MKNPSLSSDLVGSITETKDVNPTFRQAEPGRSSLA
jgi:hypothetical protein